MHCSHIPKMSPCIVKNVKCKHHTWWSVILFNQKTAINETEGITFLSSAEHWLLRSNPSLAWLPDWGHQRSSTTGKSLHELIIRNIWEIPSFIVHVTHAIFLNPSPPKCEYTSVTFPESITKTTSSTVMLVSAMLVERIWKEKEINSFHKTKGLNSIQFNSNKEVFLLEHW